MAPSLHIAYRHTDLKKYFKDYAEWRIMLNWSRFERWLARSTRHDHSLSRNVRTGSDGRYLPGAALSGAARCSARSLDYAEGLQLAIDLSLDAAGSHHQLHALADRIAFATGLDKRLCRCAFFAWSGSARCL